MNSNFITLWLYLRLQEERRNQYGTHFAVLFAITVGKQEPIWDSFCGFICDYRWKEPNMGTMITLLKRSEKNIMLRVILKF